ncbi:Polyisoprenyl-teichoic acid--peptidoglycan teichoic acid transferase TagU [Paenibacillus sp. CECT 9249]|uniref:LCP family glycopolymer transferase n=1 Tax=Paenibacillus sp. CECT 9249 TaxID=2845385 RepID=UPI001E558083|nr:LCP family protein [Paenibacillus sp. CECT 9249]CAH0121363.1 Polyisoprenyl-teichoic acid--peptidoglycan teichoic acid transferase TagU [Paenibacillus sp. CECT 9249]
MYCMKCGNKMTQGDDFCDSCGSPFHFQQQVNPGVNVTVSDEELAWFTGKRSEEYAQMWKQNRAWNWAAFFFDAYWLMYRKMYVYCTVFLAVWFAVMMPLTYVIMEKSESIFIGYTFVLLMYVFVKISLGSVANKLYLHHARRKISQIKQIPWKDASMEREIRRKGGTNLALPIIVVSIPYMVVLLIGIFYFVTMYQHMQKAAEYLQQQNRIMETSEHLLDTTSNDDQATMDDLEWDGDQWVHILLLGGDRDDLLAYTDSIVVASLDTDRKKAYLFSILRDTYVSMPGHEGGRINEFKTKGGIDLVKQTIKDYTGISIDYYVFADYEGFINLIDAMGGIDYEVEKPMEYAPEGEDPEYHIQLDEGYQHLDGHETLQYVRFRMDAMGDYARTERQRNILVAILDKLKDHASMPTMSDLIHSMSSYVITDISMGDLLQLSKVAFQLDIDDVESIQLPPIELIREVVIDDKNVIAVDEAQLQEYVQNVLHDQ